MTRREKKPKRKYTRDFKLEAVKLVLEQKMKQAQVARDLGLSPQVLWRWVTQYRQDSDQSFPGKGRLKPEDQRVRDLEQQVTRLTMERDILKKAMAYFAKVPE
jgi:transposase